MEKQGQDILEGRNAVAEALRAGKTVDKLLVAKGGTDQTLARLIDKAKKAGAVVVEADRRKLDSLSQTGAHQGVIAYLAAAPYASVEEILRRASDRGEAPLVVVCDELSDPHNLGAVIRTAECAGAHGVIIPKRRSAGMTAVVAKASAGAVSVLPVARVANIPQTLEALKKAGLWVYGAAGEAAVNLYETDFKAPAAIVIGSEGDGLGRLVRERCDRLVRIPLRGQISSLNASAAAAVLLYEALRQRMGV